MTGDTPVAAVIRKAGHVGAALRLAVLEGLDEEVELRVEEPQPPPWKRILLNPSKRASFPFLER